MVIVQNIHKQKDTPCFKYVQSYKPFASLTFFHTLNLYMRMIGFTILEGGKVGKKCIIIS
jgi:hypothetical protein